MPTQAELVDELAKLDDFEFAKVYYDASARREAAYAVRAEPLSATPTRAEAARWFAAKHLSIDPAVDSVLMLAGSEADPIRLLELHRDTPPTRGDAPVPYSYKSPVQGLDFRLQVVLVHPDDMKRIQSKSLGLPLGWTLEGAERRRRGTHAE